MPYWIILLSAVLFLFQISSYNCTMSDCIWFMRQVSLWDGIIPAKEHAKFLIHTTNKYRFIDQASTILRLNVNLIQCFPVFRCDWMVHGTIFWNLIEWRFFFHFLHMVFENWYGTLHIFDPDAWTIHFNGAVFIQWKFWMYINSSRTVSITVWSSLGLHINFG